MLLERGIRMARKHFAVGVHIDALAVRLLEKLREIVKVVAAYNNKRALFRRSWLLLPEPAYRRFRY